MTIDIVCIVHYPITFPFHLAKRIRAETERCDIVGFPKVTTKSLASGTGS